MTARPLGITILAILEALVAIVFMIAGFGALAVGGLMGVVGLGGFASLLSYGTGGVLIAIGVLSLVAAWGLWSGLRWAWYVSLALAVLSILIGILLLPGSLLWLTIEAVIVYYLTRPHVKAFFRST